jgi:hypothetical protein
MDRLEALLEFPSMLAEAGLIYPGNTLRWGLPLSEQCPLCWAPRGRLCTAHLPSLHAREHLYRCLGKTNEL